MKIQICKDVLARIESGFFHPITGDYLAIDENYFVGDNVNLKEFLEQSYLCEGCALGGLFTAHVLRFNNVYCSGRITDSPGMRRVLEEHFSKEELYLIEAYFEAGCLFGPATNKFMCRQRSPIDRLTLILHNIIDNGEFQPEKLPGLEDVKQKDFDETRKTSLEYYKEIFRKDY